MKIMCKQEYYNQVVQYAESIKDTSLQNCMERLEAWEKNPDRPCEIEHLPRLGALFVRIHPKVPGRQQRDCRRAALSRFTG